MRGVGRTELMIRSLPQGQCTVVVPKSEIGRLIAARVNKTNPGLRRYITVTHPSDVQKMHGLCEPVFFDHSFFDIVSADTARLAVDCAIGINGMMEAA